MLIAVINGLMLLFGSVSIVFGVIGLILRIKNHKSYEKFKLMFNIGWFLFTVLYLIGFFIK